MHIDRILSKRVRRISWSPIEEVSAIIRGKKDIINLASGLPDQRYMPTDIMNELLYEAYENYGKEVLSYPEAYGLEILREELKRFLGSHGVNTKGKDVIITCGAQHAVSSIARAILDDEDTYAVENPTFVETFMALKYYSEHYVPVNVTGKGLDIKSLEKASKTGIKLSYVVPNGQNPTGISYNEETRRSIAELSMENEFLVIEDDPYGLIVSGDPKPIANLTSYAIYVGSFSKILAPGLRVGFMLVPEELYETIGMTMQLDFATHPTSMYAIYEALKRGIVDSVLRTIKKVYEEKTRLALSVLEDTMPENVEWTRPKSSFHLMLFVKGINARELLKRSLERGVAFIPGDMFYVSDPRHDTIRISISYPKEDEIELGLKILSSVIRELSM